MTIQWYSRQTQETLYNSMDYGMNMVTEIQHFIYIYDVRVIIRVMQLLVLNEWYLNLENVLTYI